MSNRVYLTVFLFLFISGSSILSARGSKFEKINRLIPSELHPLQELVTTLFPTNPMNDRAIGYLLQGKINNGISNYGNIINWDEQPSGLWGDYSYLPSVAFLGLPGHKRTSEFQWSPVESVIDNDGFVVYSIWSSQSACEAWYENARYELCGHFV